MIECKTTHELIDGKIVSDQIKNEIAKEAKELLEKTGNSPCLALIIAGNDPASLSYVNSKKKACESTGIKSICYTYPEDVSELEILELIEKLNNDKQVNGILVQVPLPATIDETKILLAINPEKDVDGFHPVNAGNLWTGNNKGFIPCTPAGIIELLKHYNIRTEGKHVVIVGRSNIVGKPLAGMFLSKELNSTVTVCHSKTVNLKNITREADILIIAIGKPNFISADMVKKGAVVIDAGINRVEDLSCEKRYRVCGDIDFENVIKRASYITPVPGGVGLMTVAMLLKNTLISFKRTLT